MGSQIHQRLVVLVAIFSLLFINNQNVAAHIYLSPEGAPPASQPVASSPSSDGHDNLSPSPTPATSLPPLTQVSFPPSQANPPSAAEFPGQGSPTTSQDGGFSVPGFPGQGSPSPSMSQGGGDTSLLSSSELQLEAHSSSNSNFNFNFDNFPLNFNFDNFPGELTQITQHCDPDVKEICEATDYPPLCLATVAPFLKGAKADVQAVLEITIKITNEFAKYALTLLKKLALTPGTPEKVVSVLNDCKDSYEDILYNFENAITALAERDIGTINTMLSAVLTDCGDCEDEFKGLNFPCPITAVADKLVNMTSNCLAIGSLQPQLH